MKAILLSIKPQYCELIVSIQKKIEVRKSEPKIKPPFKCYIYQTNHKWIYKFLRSVGFKTVPEKLENARGKVIGEFVCNKITTIFYGCEIMYGMDYPNKHAKQLEDDSCLSLKELKHYANAKDIYGWHISGLKIYDKPKELSEFYYPPDKYCEKNLCGGCPYDKATIDGEIMYGCEGKRPLIRPPQSWGYVEEL